MNDGAAAAAQARADENTTHTRDRKERKKVGEDERMQKWDKDKCEIGEGECEQVEKGSISARSGAVGRRIRVDEFSHSPATGPVSSCCCRAKWMKICSSDTPPAAYSRI